MKVNFKASEQQAKIADSNLSAPRFLYFRFLETNFGCWAGALKIDVVKKKTEKISQELLLMKFNELDKATLIPLMEKCFAKSKQK